MKMLDLWITYAHSLKSHSETYVRDYVESLLMCIISINSALIFMLFGMAGLFSLSACGDDGLDAKSVLKNYRVLAMRSDPPALTLTEPTEISLYDFHPGDLDSSGRPDIEYQWKICPFSLGSVTQYKCLFDEVSLDALVQIGAGETQADDVDDLRESRPQATSTLKMTANDLLSLLGDDLQMQMEQLEMGAGMLGSDLSFFDAGQIILYIKLEVKIVGEQDFSAVKSLPLILNADVQVNENPDLIGIDADLLTMPTELRVDQDVKLEAQFSNTTSEEYIPLLSAEAESQDQEPELQTESLLFSWYTTSGTFDKPIRLAEDTSTNLTLGEDSGNHRIYLTLRDGRGGVDLRMVEFEVLP